jgi:hypothetical protein
MMDFTEEELKKAKDEKLLECFLAMGSYNPLAGPVMIKDNQKKFKLLEKELLARLKERIELLNKKEKSFRMRTKKEIFTRKRIMGPFRETEEEAEILSDPNQFIKK